MKNYLLGVITIISILAIFSFSNKVKESDVPDKEWIIAPRFLTLQEGVVKEEARDWLENEFLLLYRDFPGFNAMVGEPIKTAGWGKTSENDKEKDFVMIYFFDSKKTFYHYFPKNGGWSDEINEGIKRHQSTFDKLFNKYFVEDRYQVEDYLMFASAK